MSCTRTLHTILDCVKFKTGVSRRLRSMMSLIDSQQSPSLSRPGFHGGSSGSPGPWGQDNPFERARAATVPFRPYSPDATALGGLGLCLLLLLSLFLVGSLLVFLDGFLHCSRSS